MIYVDRDRGPSPPAQWFARAETARRRAIDEATDHVIDDAVYGAVEVRVPLEQLFAAKCAYCESPCTATGPWDVEHFRPKKRVAEDVEHPGYFWLAYEWTNLFLSCQACNRRLRDAPTHDEPTYGPAAGKGNHFPVLDERRRARGPGDDIGREPIAILDPCRDDPEEHLVVNLDGRILAVGGSARGAATRDVCNLDRRRLRVDREKRARLAVELVEQFVAEFPSADLERVIGIVGERLGAAAQPWALVGRSLVRDPKAFGFDL